MYLLCLLCSVCSSLFFIARFRLGALGVSLLFSFCVVSSCCLHVSQLCVCVAFPVGGLLCMVVVPLVFVDVLGSYYSCYVVAHGCLKCSLMALFSACRGCV